MGDQNNFFDILNLASLIVGLQNLRENREQSVHNDVQAENDKQAHYILGVIEKQFAKQNEMLLEILAILRANERPRETECDECSCQLLFERDLWIEAADRWQRDFESARADTAREIFEEIEECMSCFEDDDDGYLLKKCEFEYFMRELKKKYLEGEG